LQPGAGGCKTQRPHNKFFIRRKTKFLKSVFVRSPAYNKLKTSNERREAKLLTNNASKPKLLGAGVVRARPPQRLPFTVAKI